MELETKSHFGLRDHLDGGSARLLVQKGPFTKVRHGVLGLGYSVVIPGGFIHRCAMHGSCGHEATFASSSPAIKPSRMMATFCQKAQATLS